MKKLVSYVLLLATMLNIFVVSASASTASPVETFDFGGEQYTLERNVTEEYSQSTLKDCNGKIAADFTYYFATGDLVDNLTGYIVPHTREVENRIVPFAVDESKFKYRFTDTYTLDLLKYGVNGAITAISTYVGFKAGGVGGAMFVNGLTDVLKTAISDGLNSVCLKVDVYTYTEDHYFHQKRVGNLYSSKDDSFLYGPMTTYQTVREK